MTIRGELLHTATVITAPSDDGDRARKIYFTPSRKRGGKGGKSAGEEEGDEGRVYDPTLLI